MKCVICEGKIESGNSWLCDTCFKSYAMIRRFDSHEVATWAARRVRRIERARNAINRARKALDKEPTP